MSSCTGRPAARAGSAILTPQGQRFLPHALAFLDRARELCQACDLETGQQDVRIVASQYLTRYVLIDVLRAFRGVAPAIHVRVSTMNESDAVDALLGNSDVAFGLAAPYESSPSLHYSELFAMNWSLITPRQHRLAASRKVSLTQIARHALILYEKGSTGRQHVLDAFHEHGLTPSVALETTSTETVVSMVEAGLGVAIVPLMSNGAVTRNRRVDVRVDHRRDPADSLRRAAASRRDAVAAGRAAAGVPQIDLLAGGYSGPDSCTTRPSTTVSTDRTFLMSASGTVK